MEDTMHDYYLMAAVLCWICLVASLIERRMPKEY